MWNQNSDNNKSKDVSVAETTNNIVDDHEKSAVATSPASSISGGNGKTTKTNRSSGVVGSGGVGGGGGCGGESNNLGHCSTSKDKDNYTDQSEGAIDSGFLSGPQLTEDYDNDEDFATQSNTRKSIPPVQLNIVQSKQQSQQKNQQQTSDYLDSGCIDVDYELDEEQEQHEKQSRARPAITTTAASPQQRGQQQNKDDQMILEKGVDSGVSEWFCKLTLRDPNQQVNNLGAGSSSSGTESASWEIYYQQNNEGDTQLHLACMGYVDVVAALISMAPHPCLFNIQNDEAQTSLHLAVIYGQPKILRMLLIAGAEPTARDRHGNTPLHLACISGDTQCVKALTIPISASEINEAHRSYGHLSSDKTTSYLDCARLPADLEIRNYDGERCVHLAAQGGHIDILRHLVWFGADINAREGKSGRTCLHVAIESCNEVLANFLLEECSTLNIETATFAGLTAYQVACILDNPTMQNHLEKNGAQTLTPPDSDYDSSDIETDLDDSQMFNRFGDPRYFANYNGGGNPINVA